jgi:hypothetical protein
VNRPVCFSDPATLYLLEIRALSQSRTAEILPLPSCYFGTSTRNPVTENSADTAPGMTELLFLIKLTIMFPLV